MAKKRKIDQINQGAKPNAKDASSEVDVKNKVQPPASSYNEKLLNKVGTKMLGKSSFLSLSGDEKTNRQDWVNSNINTLDAQNTYNLNFLNDASIDASGSTTEMVGAWRSDFTNPGLQRSTTFRSPRGAEVGSDVVSVLDKATGGGINSMSRSDYESKNPQLNPVDKKIYTNWGTSKGEDGNIYTSDSGWDSKLDFDYGPSMLNSASKSKYSPIDSSEIKTRTFDQVHTGHTTTDSLTGNTDFYNTGNLGEGKVIKVAPQFKSKENLKADSFKKLSVEETLSPLSVERTKQGRKGSGKSSGGIGKTGRNKVVKLKGQVDLDMSGEVDTKLERKAKSFAGMNNIYSTRGAARRDLKNKGIPTQRDEGKIIQGRSFTYKKDGEKISAQKFKDKASSNIKTFNKNQANYNTAQMNAGVGQKTLTGNNSYASVLNVNTGDAFGQTKRTTLTKTQKKTNLQKEKQDRKGNVVTKLTKYGKQQKRMDNRTARRIKIKQSVNNAKKGIQNLLGP